MGWIGVKRRFRVEDNGVIRANCDDDEDWTEIHSEREQKEIIDWACEIPAPEDNRGLPRRLVVAIQKKKSIVNRLETQQK